MYYYKKKDMYIFTPEEKYTAKNISTIDFLEKNYNYHFKPSGTMFRCIEHDSLIVRPDGRGWHWNSRDMCGSDVLEFLQKIENKTYESALMTVLNVTPGSSNVSSTPFKPAPPPDFKTAPPQRELLLPPKCKNSYKRVFAYLNKTRCIDEAIINILVHKKYIYEDMRHNVVFVGYNKVGLAAYAAVRTTLSDVKYRKDAIGSDKSNGFYLKGYNQSELYVFESPIDLLSHATICNRDNNDPKSWLQNSRLSLGGISDVALEQYLRDYSDVKKIVFCLDNDLAGRQATKKLMMKYSDLGYETVDSPPQNKDYNEDLVKSIKKVKQARI